MQMSFAPWPQGQNFSDLVKAFVAKHFLKPRVDKCEVVVSPEVTRQPQQSVYRIAEKSFANRHKIAKFAKVSALESFPLYTVIDNRDS